MNAVALHEQRQTIGTTACIGNTIVAYERKGCNKYLTCIAGVSEAFRIASHGCIEDHFTYSITFISE